MKQLKLISNEKNEFIFDSGGIVQTEVTLVMTNPNRDAKMILHHGSVINFISVHSSIIRVVTTDGTSCDTPILCDELVILTDSIFEGTLSMKSNRIITRGETDIKRLNLRNDAAFSLNPGTVQSFHDYRYYDTGRTMLYAEFCDYVDHLESLNFKKTPTLYGIRALHEFRRYMVLLDNKKTVNLQIGFDNIAWIDKEPSSAKRYTLEANEFGQAFLSTDLFGDSDIVRNKTIWVRKNTEEYPVTIIIQNQKDRSNRFIFENVIFFARNTTIKFENPPEEITVINSILSNLLAENANLAIVHSQINTLKIKTDAKLKRFENSEITGIETMF